MPTVPKSEAEILNTSKLLWDAQGNGWTDSQVYKLMSGGDPRTGTFYQKLPTVGDTTCIVNGVLWQRYQCNWTVVKVYKSDEIRRDLLETHYACEVFHATDSLCK